MCGSANPYCRFGVDLTLCIYYLSPPLIDIFWRLVFPFPFLLRFFLGFFCFFCFFFFFCFHPFYLFPHKQLLYWVGGNRHSNIYHRVTTCLRIPRAGALSPRRNFPAGFLGMVCSLYRLPSPYHEQKKKFCFAPSWCLLLTVLAQTSRL